MPTLDDGAVLVQDDALVCGSSVWVSYWAWLWTAVGTLIVVAGTVVVMLMLIWACKWVWEGMRGKHNWTSVR